jgi:hypothetical protein
MSMAGPISAEHDRDGFGHVVTDPDTGTTWLEFCRSIEQAASCFTDRQVELDEVDRAEGLRFLGRLTRSALQALDPSDDPRRPRFAPFGPPDVTFGIPNPDNLYQRCSVDPALDYTITGRRNTVRFLGFGAQSVGRAVAPGTASHLDARRLMLEPDGSFEIAASARRQPGNWIELTSDARSIMVRQTFLRPEQEQAAEVAIECRQPTADRHPIATDTVARRLRAAAARVTMLASFWPEWVAGFADHAAINQFFLFDEVTHLALGGDPQVRTPLCRWRLGTDEALVIELRPPRCDYWNVQLATIWTEPIEPLTGRSARNAAHVASEPDGSVHVVVADRDPGVGNWLDPGGHRQGTACVRWVNADAYPIPTTRVIPVRDLE